MYDPICKFLAESYSSDFARWLLGEETTLTQLSPSELLLEPIRADSLILLESSSEVLHLEFQKEPDPNMAFRMLDYRTRVYRRFPNKEMRQVVIYLKKTGSELVEQTVFELSKTRHEFGVIKLWEIPPEELGEGLGLLPLAVLGKTEDREETLKTVAERIESIENRTEKSNIMAATAILAGLILKKEVIQKLIREDIMKESVIYQDILAQGEVKGEVKLILRLLNRRFGQIPPSLATKIQSLSLERLEQLAEDLLDFTSVEDLINWLSERSS
ncbi:hypothetical protein C7H19_22350 [Aphanothece hegewaldii CCALA 016]|uniref:DUF4351 domain-containing protein n=1 Tax=Aphanothece hegewaldii CCALA 016 TaxID=2107694 RepID=A0A2T1LRS5_9CHRO|nr:Rpn family recombination-promoting nuclease/putative transposase [Aphanothece hegewaldii]PSF31683.1 hypothetical protein C7H19_22350 [Aphanothece hegewaldii CCALA 016]